MLTVPKYKLIKLEAENQYHEEIQEYIDTEIVPKLKEAALYGYVVVGNHIKWQAYVDKALSDAGWVTVWDNNGKWVIKRKKLRLSRLSRKALSVTPLTTGTGFFVLAWGMRMAETNGAFTPFNFCGLLMCLVLACCTIWACTDGPR